MDVAKQCALDGRLDWLKISQCTVSRLGNQLQHDMGLRTDSLVPKHTFIPWIVVQGESAGYIQKEALSDLKGLVCSEYKGLKPKACHV